MQGNNYAKNWVFTWNNPEFELNLESVPLASYIIYQKEQGENGTIHYQGYLEASRRVRLSQLKNIHQGIHWEVRRGSQAQAIDYARKEDTRIDGPWEYGVPMQSVQGRRSDLVSVARGIGDGRTFGELSEEFEAECLQYRRSILEAVRERDRQKLKRTMRESMEVVVYWGDAGAGKTRAVYEENGIENVFALTECSNGTVWFDGYEGEDVLLIDDFRGWIRFQQLLKLLDIYPLRIPIKGSYDYAAWTKVYITSNHSPDSWYNPDSGHYLPALRRRIHRTVHFSNDHPWLPGDDTVGGIVSEDADHIAREAELLGVGR